MISLEDFTKIIENINNFREVNERLYDNFKIDLIEIVEPLNLALETALRSLVPEEKVDYLFKSIYETEMNSKEDIKEAYERIFRKG
jgi:hypothetical protein